MIAATIELEINTYKTILIVLLTHYYNSIQKTQTFLANLTLTTYIADTPLVAILSNSLISM